VHMPAGLLFTLQVAVDSAAAAAAAAAAYVWHSLGCVLYFIPQFSIHS
jgi:hypothetical protein